ncbi:MAG: cell envelope biogenesis protein OmpA, partial [Nitrospirae bacterium CG08_land_8_20_14_0_20_52_24]
MKRFKLWVVGAVLVSFFSTLIGCAQWEQSTKTTKGAVTGAGVGAIAGALVKRGDPSQRAKAALIGAAIGATAGG